VREEGSVIAVIFRSIVDKEEGREFCKDGRPNFEIFFEHYGGPHGQGVVKLFFAILRRFSWTAKKSKNVWSKLLSLFDNYSVKYGDFR